MSKYICEKTKDEILEIIADEFDKVTKITIMRCRMITKNSRNGIRVDT